MASVAHSTTNDSDLFKSPQHSIDGRATSPPGSDDDHPTNELEEDPTDPKLLTIGVTLHRMKDGYAGRANTIGSFFELNRQVRG